MKRPELGDYLLWQGKPAQIIGTADERTVIIEMLEDQKCPHCKGNLGKKHIHVIPTSNQFKEYAKSIPTI